MSCPINKQLNCRREHTRRRVKFAWRSSPSRSCTEVLPEEFVCAVDKVDLHDSILTYSTVSPSSDRLDALNIDTATLVGNSMGGIISLALVTTDASRVDKLVLMGGGGAPLPPSPELIKLITFYKEPTTEAMADLLTCFVADPSFFGDNLNAIAAERLPLAMRPEVERSHRATFAKGEPLTFPPELLATVMNETLVVHGENDRLIPIAAGEYFAEHLPNVTFDRFPNTGHWLMIEQAQPFADRVRAFMHGS